MSLLGVVKDYTIRGAKIASVFEIEIETSATNKSAYEKLYDYIKKYILEIDIPKFLPDSLTNDFRFSIIECGEKLIDFVYEFIEKRRRSALGIMLQVARIGAKQGP